MASDRPSKKQQELLSFIDGFIKGNGYGPSYREVMRALGYKSPSTVAAHVDALVAKGHLRKGDGYSARSIEVVGRENTTRPAPAGHLEWFRMEVDKVSAGGDTPPELLEAYQTVLDHLDSSVDKR